MDMSTLADLITPSLILQDIGGTIEVVLIEMSESPTISNSNILS